MLFQQSMNGSIKDRKKVQSLPISQAGDEDVEGEDEFSLPRLQEQEKSIAIDDDEGAAGED